MAAYESLKNISPADIYSGRHHRIEERGEEIKKENFRIKGKQNLLREKSSVNNSRL